MTKTELKILEKAFNAEVNNAYFQNYSKSAKKLVENGYLKEYEHKVVTGISLIAIKFLSLTTAGKEYIAKTARLKQ